MMNKRIVLLGLVSGAIGVGACANTGTIYREKRLDKGDSLVLDAKQRIVTNFTAEPWSINGKDPTTKKDGPPRYIAPSRIVCPEPSPDVASSL
jgi:hypothetical protein